MGVPLDDEIQLKWILIGVTLFFREPPFVSNKLAY